MISGKKLKYAHSLSILFFLFCAAYLLIILLQRNSKDWFFWSISGLSGFIATAIIVFYSLAFFKSLTLKSSKPEHPISSSSYYLVFYDMSPFLGAAAGVIVLIMVNEKDHPLAFIAAGSMAASFFVWIVLDPVVQVLEMMLPGSKRFRKRRKAFKKAIKKAHEKANLSMLNEIDKQEKEKSNERQALLSEMSRELRRLLDQRPSDESDKGIIEYGLKAWQMGKLPAMKQLYDLTVQNDCTEYKAYRLSYLWDGVGKWRYETEYSV